MQSLRQGALVLRSTRCSLAWAGWRSGGREAAQLGSSCLVEYKRLDMQIRCKKSQRSDAGLDKKHARNRKWRRKWLGKAQGDDDPRVTGLGTFSKAFAEHPTSVKIDGGELMIGRVDKVSTGSRSVDFGLKRDAVFSKQELHSNEVGSKVVFPILSPEDDFCEPEIDYSRSLLMPSVQAGRMELLFEALKHTKTVQVIRGRVMDPLKGGFAVRALGQNFFLPATHALGMPGPLSWLERENHEFTQYLARRLCGKAK